MTQKKKDNIFVWELIVWELIWRGETSRKQYTEYVIHCCHKEIRGQKLNKDSKFEIKPVKQATAFKPQRRRREVALAKLKGILELFWEWKYLERH